MYLNSSTPMSHDIFVRPIFKEMINLHKRWVALVLTSSLIGLTGCNADNQNAGNDTSNNVGMNNINNNIRNNDMTGRNVSNQDTRTNRAIRNVERLREVDQAHVVISNNVAWVTVSLNRGQQNTAGDLTGTRNGNRDRSYENNPSPDITGTGRETNDGTANLGINPSNGGTGTNTSIYNNNDGTGGRNGNHTDAGTNRITGNTTTNNTGTDVHQNNWTNGSDFKEATTVLEQKIADQVRKTNKNINKVYISYHQE
jgi:hypothetical protein